MDRICLLRKEIYNTHSRIFRTESTSQRPPSRTCQSATFHRTSLSTLNNESRRGTRLFLLRFSCSFQCLRTCSVAHAPGTITRFPRLRIVLILDFSNIFAFVHLCYLRNRVNTRPRWPEARRALLDRTDNCRFDRVVLLSSRDMRLRLKRRYFVRRVRERLAISWSTPRRDRRFASNDSEWNSDLKRSGLTRLLRLPTTL
mmetsp:Transcript_7220/g.23919  ORF Transcript_7220/g.23919 Transcript_7220/m.23919 type:complete len:200 (+) Transcript_7220:5101-5700(+)